MYNYRYSVISWKTAPNTSDPHYGHGGVKSDDLKDCQIDADIRHEDNTIAGVKHGVMDMTTKEVVYKA